MEKKKRRNANQLLGMRRMRCPYCGSPVILRSAEGIYKTSKNGARLYACSKYPQCDAYVRVHEGTTTPVGTLANHELRSLRRSAHRYFDMLYQTGIMNKRDAYVWLSNLLSVPLSQAHIGYLGDYYCQQVIDESKKILEKYGRLPKQSGRSAQMTVREGVEGV